MAGHLSKQSTGRFAKAISFFRRGSNENSYEVEVTVKKRVKFGDGEGLQIPCKLHFTGDAKYIGKLRDILPIVLYIYLFILFYPIF